MPTFPVAVARRLVLAATAIVVLAAPALARAQARVLWELGYIQAPVESLECPGSTEAAASWVRRTWWSAPTRAARTCT